MLSNPVNNEHYCILHIFVLHLIFGAITREQLALVHKFPNCWRKIAGPIQLGVDHREPVGIQHALDAGDRALKVVQALKK